MSNEITVKLKCEVKELIEILENKKFKLIDRYCLEDIYFIPSDLPIKSMSYREILSKAILLRQITKLMKKAKTIQLTFKHKEIDEKGDIVNQDKINCVIIDFQSGKIFLKAIGYVELMEIKENDFVYQKDGFEIAIKDVYNSEKLLEVEVVEENKELNSIEKLKQKLLKLDIPVDYSNFFVKKAEIELSKIL